MSKYQLFSLEGRIALVTGASRGIGRATCLVLGQAGADIALVSRDVASMEGVAEEVRGMGRQALIVPTDISVGAEIEGMVAHVLEVFGKIDILVNNAGIGSTLSIQEITDEMWDTMLDTNLRGAFICARTVIPTMKAQRWGRIVNIASISGQTGGVLGGAHYAASKGGMIALTKTLSRETAPFNITVNAIAPGQIDTSMGRLTPEQREKMVSMIPLGRLGRPEEIAYAVLFLASEEAGYITGATLDVNGGILKR
jgi:3-oxoacyl-[acyl-carrier protein] reductase